MDIYEIEDESIGVIVDCDVYYPDVEEWYLEGTLDNETGTIEYTGYYQERQYYDDGTYDIMNMQENITGRFYLIGKYLYWIDAESQTGNEYFMKVEW